MTEHYVELHCHSYFTLLDAASAPEALVVRAKELGLPALALTDRDSMAGAVRFWVAAQAAGGLHAILGAEVSVEPLDGDGKAGRLILLVETQQGYANLCRLITHGYLRDGMTVIPTDTDPAWLGKTPPRASWDALNDCRGGLMALTGGRDGLVASSIIERRFDRAVAAAQRLRDVFGSERLWVELQQHYLPDSDRLMRNQMVLASQLGLPVVATNGVHYATRAESRLRDAMIAIDQNITLNEARRSGLLPINANAAMIGADDMARRFVHLPQALHNSVLIAERCKGALDFGAHRLPEFQVPDGRSEFEYLYALCQASLSDRYPRITPAVLKQLTHELIIIEQAGLAGYFLIVWDIVRFSREKGIRCQGRGSAANSIVAYLLGITSIDPLQHHLLFERFLSPDRHTMPDIDIDFAADRREEVIQYVYTKYGREHTGMVCNWVTYHARSALRDLGKVLEFPTPVIDRLSASLETNSATRVADALLEQVEAGNDAVEHPLRLLAMLMRQIDGCPRHLSIHTGGMLITGPPLDQVVPLERATMPGRVVCQWNKDSVEDAGLIKIDLLGLRTLGLVTEALSTIDTPLDIDRLPLDDPAIYMMLQRADTIGTFQVESRAQMQMLPRLAPRVFEDIIIEVAIVRPGPIQGGTVHPYLRRRAGEELVSYAHPLLESALNETLGVLLFQEQAIRMAVLIAGFAPGEADSLRRALSRFGGGELTPALRELGTRFLAGSARNGIDTLSAEASFKQLAGFAGYGLCKSHAASFALIAYQTCWLKHYHPAAFYCALLNQQPMGFYSPEVIIGDMRRHGVNLWPPDINLSDYNYRVEMRNSMPGLRTGLRAVHGMGKEVWERVRVAREASAGVFSGLVDLCKRTRLQRDVVSDLIRAGALDSMGDRRELLWQLGELVYQDEELPFVFPVTEVILTELSELEQMDWEYELLGLSPTGQAMRHYRPALDRAGVLTTQQVKQQRNGRRVRVGGMQVIRQRPPTAKGLMFLSIEDETGLLDVIVLAKLYETYRQLLHEERLLLVEGVVQQGSGATSLMATQMRRLYTG